jgi:hypothetical protein
MALANGGDGDTAGGWLVATLAILFLLGLWLGPGGGSGKGGKK